MPETARYIGRFAPSPTGPLHFGSLLAAVASYLEARHRGGCWLLRMEDLDPPREQPGAADHILRTLDAFGFDWDGPVLRQSTRAAAYRAALDDLRVRGLAYPCACTRREIAARGRTGLEGPIYPGTCRAGLPPGRRGRALRVRTDGARISFHDALQGPRTQNLEREIGDFVLRRADGYWAYQLAVVVDDAAQGITHVVRGADLLGSTPRQIHLFHLLGLPIPAYAHIPVAVDARGEKLSKQTGARAVSPDPATLWQALAFLRQAPPAELRTADLTEIWAWARVHWRAERLCGLTALPLAGEGTDDALS